MLLSLLLSLFGGNQVWALTLVFALVYGMVFVSLIDSVLMWRRIKAKLTDKFGADAIPRRLDDVCRDARLPDPAQPPAAPDDQARRIPRLTRAAGEVRARRRPTARG
jgi:hypothetical protein